MLPYDGEPLPTLKAMDEHGGRLLGSFSKTFYPGLRIGYLVLGQEVQGGTADLRRRSPPSSPRSRA